MTAVIEKPMLFSGPMILRLLDGSKTQTRRLVANRCRAGVWAPLNQPHSLGGELWGDSQCEPFRCPHPVGSRVWVRETWQAYQPLGDYPLEGPCYRSTGHAPTCKLANHLWRPSIFMPRKFSRITLEITAVRVERLQDITEADAKAEGARLRISGVEDTIRGPEPTSNFRTGFVYLWESINGKTHPWVTNPFVFVYEFRRLKP